MTQGGDDAIDGCIGKPLGVEPGLQFLDVTLGDVIELPVTDIGFQVEFEMLLFLDAGGPFRRFLGPGEVSAFHVSGEKRYLLAGFNIFRLTGLKG